MSDPRQRRAEQIRESVASFMAQEGHGMAASTISRGVRDSLPGSIRRRQVESALQHLRREGRVRYQGRRWELVPS